MRVGQLLLKINISQGSGTRIPSFQGNQILEIGTQSLQTHTSHATHTAWNPHIWSLDICYFISSQYWHCFVNIAVPFFCCTLQCPVNLDISTHSFFLPLVIVIWTVSTLFNWWGERVINNFEETIAMFLLIWHKMIT